VADGDALLARLAAAHHGIFSREHARQCGLTNGEIHRRVTTGLWDREHHRAYRFVAAPRQWRGDVLAACWAGGFRAYASHRSAAALWGLAGGSEDFVEITCPRWSRARHDGLIVHESKAFDNLDKTYVDRVPVTTPARTLIDLGAVCGMRTVEIAADRAVRLRLTSHDELVRTLQRLGRSGRNGVGKLRKVLALRGPTLGRAASEMETRLLQVLRRRGLPEPVLQLEIELQGSFIARVDAAYPQWRVAIEYDSDEWHSGVEERRRDSSRRNRILAAGWTPITATFDDVRAGGTELVRAIRAAARRFGVENAR
jgi:very-short-patch-repair endonuclease